ncbi:hypothetical protein OG232_04825 [Streptomyces sp. NBC_01411]|uniref:hypothetical protein n=1 Tax=Streptomyces sp. NBC_01411 TaxID=2903857 RepID=UPI0032446A1C
MPRAPTRGLPSLERGEGELVTGRGCLSVLATPSCFGFLLFVSVWLLACAWHDLAI